MVNVYRSSLVEWNQSSVVALTTSADGSQVVTARGDGSLEIWLVSPGSVGWNCQLTIQGGPQFEDVVAGVVSIGAERFVIAPVDIFQH